LTLRTELTVNPKDLLQGTLVMMNHLGINLTSTCNKAEILTKLKINRDQHSQRVKEAREGYVTKAQEELTKKLNLLKEGKLVALSFSLKVPKDFTTVYNTTIGMLEAHTKEEIELSADEYRHLIEDNWEWTREFLTSNVGYSKSTSDYAASKGYFDVE